MNRSNLSRRPSNKIKTKSFTFKGGLNLVDAPMSIKNGSALGLFNYEILSRNEGYRRIEGFERYDGQDSPGNATYWILDYDGGTGAISEGDTVEGATSAATAEVLLVVGDTVSGYLVLTYLTGAFQDDENIEVSAVVKAVADGTADLRSAALSADDSTHMQDAIETQRDKILTVGGAASAGPVLGINTYQGIQYAFRDNLARTECEMWKSTAAGWVKQDLGVRVEFTSGSTEYFDGDQLKQGTTTATINRVVLQSGTWVGGDAAGIFIIGPITNGPFAAGMASGGSPGAGQSTLSGAETANTLLPGGRFEFENYNFFGTSGSFRMYGVDGVNSAFEWDGSVFVPIFTGNTNDTPTHLAINEYHLMLAFEKGSLQNSATGTPYLWSGGGAAEIGTGDELIGLKKEVGSALAVICRNRTFNLQGKNTTDSPWDLKTVSDESGGIEWTVQRIGKTRYLDDRGFTEMAAVQEYGDFKDSVYSQLIEPMILAQKGNVTASVIIKTKSQYRIFFNDGTGIICTFNGDKVAGFSLIRYTNAAGSSIPVRCVSNGEDSLGTEVIFFGSDDGYVYQMDKGTSFDGGEVTATAFISYANLDSPTRDKQFKKITLEADGSAGTELKYNVLLDYSTGRSPAGIQLSTVMTAGGSLWNAVLWNAFNWASSDVSQIEDNIDGIGRNIAIQFSSTSIYTEPHTLYGITYHFIYRKLVR